jgi:hypothetical protein
MTDVPSISENISKHVPWNKGKIVGAKPPLRPKHVWYIRTKLQVEGRTRDLALFNVAIDSKLRDCDVVALKVDEVAPSGYAADRASVRQENGTPGQIFGTYRVTRRHHDDYLSDRQKPGEYLFTGRRGHERSLLLGSTPGCSQIGSPV